MSWLRYASGAPYAVNVTPGGVPVVGAVIALGVLAFLVGDAHPISAGGAGRGRDGCGAYSVCGPVPARQNWTKCPTCPGAPLPDALRPLPPSRRIAWRPSSPRPPTPT